jgi:hypothetical protein
MIVVSDAGVSLKPCPLCGGSPLLKGDNQTGAQVHGATRQPIPEHFWVKCQTDGCGISPQATSNQRLAVEAWNRRA